MSKLKLLTLFVFTILAQWADAGENIALGKKYTLSPPPNYALCTDSGDAVQLTDGIITDQYLWTQPGCVGWNGPPWADVTIDLEQEEPISSVAFTSAASGSAGVPWPMSALFFVSPNGDDWYFIGDIMILDLEQNGARTTTEYNMRKISASGLACKGRFAKILVHCDQNIFMDEIEIGRGDAALLEKPYPGEPEKDVNVRAQREDYLNIIRSRYITDAGNAADLILEKSQTVESPKKEELVTLAEQVRAVRADEKWLSTLDVAAFKTIFPFDSVQTGLFASMAKMRRILDPDIAPLLVDRILPYDAPNILTGAEPFAEESLLLASGEIKPVVYQLLNTSEEPITVSFSVDNTLRSLCQEVFSVLWTDTNHLNPVATALVPLTQNENGQYEVTLTPGLTSQIWLDVNAKGIQAGNYNGSIHFSASNVSAEKPLHIQVSTVTLPEEQTMILGGWDYSNFGGKGPVTMKNRDAFIAMMKKYGVNGPWSSPGLFFVDAKANLSDPDHLTVSFNTEEAEKWIALWQEAKEYYVFLDVRKEFCGYSYDTPEFEQLVTDWAKKCGVWFESKGISPSRVSLFAYDEPRAAANPDCPMIYAWWKAIRAGEPRFRLWENPIYSPPAHTPKEFFEFCDTLCPSGSIWMGGRKEFEEIYRPLVAAGKRLDLYACLGPVFLLDPYSYHRLQAWLLFREGGTGSFFWAFFDGTGTPWNEYRGARTNYAPMFIEPENSHIIAAKQIAAMRESVYDFEILTMYQNQLKYAKANGKNIEKEEQWLMNQIDCLLDEEGAKDIQWPKAKDRTGADRIREEILHRLEVM